MPELMHKFVFYTKESMNFMGSFLFSIFGKRIKTTLLITETWILLENASGDLRVDFDEKSKTL